MNETLYEVYETSPDLDHIWLMFQGFHRDIAESKMYKIYSDSGCTKDFMLYNRSTKDAESLCLSPKSRQLRNECGS